MGRRKAYAASMEVVCTATTANKRSGVVEIPQTHIVCTSTLASRDRARMNQLTEGRVWDIDTGHNLMITEPRRTADALLGIAGL